VENYYTFLKVDPTTSLENIREALVKQQNVLRQKQNTLSTRDIDGLIEVRDKEKKLGEAAKVFANKEARDTYNKLLKEAGTQPAPDNKQKASAPPVDEIEEKELPPAKNEYHQFRRDQLYANAFSVGNAELFFVGGMGTFVGVYTQSWDWAVGTVPAMFLLAYMLGYRKALSWLPLSIIALVSGLLVYGITMLFAPFHYDQVQTSYFLFNITRPLTLRHQIIAGTCIGVLPALTGFLVFFSSRKTSFEIDFYFGTILFGLGGGIILWLIVTLLGSIFNWGFGFGYGWNLNFLGGFVVTTFAGLGVIILFYVWSKARRA
jgi:hypothetical protein